VTEDIVVAVPVPFPEPLTVNLLPPDAVEVLALSRGVVGVIAPDGTVSPLQRVLIDAVVRAMTGFPPDLTGDPVGPAEFARVMAHRDRAFRTRIVQMVLLFVLVLQPIPAEVVDRAAELAREAGVDEGMIAVAQEFAEGSLGLASIDFDRNGYAATWKADDERALHVSSRLAKAWDAVVDDPALAGQWQELECLPEGTLGRRVADFYRARGFHYPGMPGSAPPLLAQHDWVHVLADYGTTVESELEVFAFIARANDDMRAFSLLAMVVSLFETGYLATGAGLFESDRGHLSQEGVATRLADAMRRGARCTGSIDFLRTDWFSIAHLQVDEVRARFGVVAKATEAVDHGSVGPWEPGGISAFQWKAGRALAVGQGRPYEAFGASI
jgi:hypothetical protein